MDAWAASRSPWEDADTNETVSAQSSSSTADDAPKSASTERPTNTLGFEPDPWAEPSPFAGPPSPVATRAPEKRTSLSIPAATLDTADPWQSDTSPSQWGGALTNEASMPSASTEHREIPWSAESASSPSYQAEDEEERRGESHNMTTDDPWLSERPSEIDNPVPAMQDVSLAGNEWGNSSYATQPEPSPSTSTMPARLSDLPISFTSTTGSALVGGQKAEMNSQGVLTARDVQIQQEEEQRARGAEATDKGGPKEQTAEAAPKASRFAAALASWRKPAAKPSDDTSRAPQAPASSSPKAETKKVESAPAAATSPKKAAEGTPTAGVSAVISGLFAKTGPPQVVDAADDDEDDDDDVPIATIAQRHAHSRQGSAAPDLFGGPTSTTLPETKPSTDAEGASAVKRFLGRWQKPSAAADTSKSSQAGSSKAAQDDDWGQWLDGVATKSASIDGGSRTSGPSADIFDEDFLAAPLPPSQIQAARTAGSVGMSGSLSNGASNQSGVDLSAFDSLGSLPSVTGRTVSGGLSRSQSLQQSSRVRPSGGSGLGFGRPQSSLARNAAAASGSSRVFSNSSTATSGSMAGSDDAFGDFGSASGRADALHGPPPAGTRRGRYANRPAEPTRAAVKSWASTGRGKRHNSNDPDPAWDWEQSDEFGDGGPVGAGASNFVDDPDPHGYDEDDYDLPPAGAQHDPHPHAEVYDDEDLSMACGGVAGRAIEQNDNWDWETAPAPVRGPDFPPTPPSKSGASFNTTQRASGTLTPVGRTAASPQPTLIIAPSAPGALPKLAPPPRIKPPPGTQTRIAPPAPPAAPPPAGTSSAPLVPALAGTSLAPLAPTGAHVQPQQTQQQQRHQSSYSLSKGKGLTNDDLSFFENL